MIEKEQATTNQRLEEIFWTSLSSNWRTNRLTNSTLRGKLEDELEDKLEVNLEDEVEETNSRIFDSTLNNCLVG